MFWGSIGQNKLYMIDRENSKWRNVWFCFGGVQETETTAFTVNYIPSLFIYSNVRY